MKKIIVFGLIAMLLCFAVPAFATSDSNPSAIGIEAALPAPGESVIAVSLGEKEVITQLGCVTSWTGANVYFSSLDLNMLPGLDARNDTERMYGIRYPPGRVFHQIE